MKKRKSLFSILAVICLVVAALALVAYAMTVDTLQKMQAQMQTYIIADMGIIQATPKVVKTAMTADTGQELVVASTPVKSIYLNGQFAQQPAEVPENYYILASVTIKAKNGAMAVTKNIYLLKTVMVNNQGGMAGIAPQLATTAQKTLKI